LPTSNGMIIAVVVYCMSADAAIARTICAPLVPVSPRDGERSSTEFCEGRVAHWYDAEGDGVDPAVIGVGSAAESNDQPVAGGAYSSRSELGELIVVQTSATGPRLVWRQLKDDAMIRPRSLG
jgi:hypothetical protein